VSHDEPTVSPTRSGPLSRSAAEAADAEDSLAPFRDRVVFESASADRNDPARRIYLDGNSLGRLPVGAAARVADLLTREWGEGLVASWDAWLDEATRVGDVLGTGLLGARAGEVVVADSTTVNLYKLAAAALDEAAARDATRRVVVTDSENFPTDRYVLEGLCAARSLTLQVLDVDPVEGPSLDALARVLADDDVALLSLSHIAYRGGARLDLAAVNELAATAGVRVLWDLAHSVGAVPVDLHATGCQLAVGCTYKYVNAGPGAPAFLYVRRDLQARLRSPIWGWFGQQDQFAMAADYRPVDGIGRFTAGTPPVAGIALVDAGASLLVEAGLDRLAAKGAALTALVIDLADEWLAPHDLVVATPRDATRRGSHVSLRHPAAWQICQAMIADGVVPDFRAPDLVRLGPAPLYTSFVDVWDALDRLRRIMTERRYEQSPTTRGRVT
jgi:kynureninase